MDKKRPQIICLKNGPYSYRYDPQANVVPYLKNSKGEPCSTVTGVSLCRCGGSGNKPFCDGTHSKIGFDDSRKSHGKWDKRISYEGKEITIHDNRELCAHSGVCVDNLASVFKLNEKPWIDPDGASEDRIVEVIKRCPSGALSYSIDGVEMENPHREPQVTVTHNGPYALTGGIEVVGQQKGEGASEEHCTLCRCGQSENKPFCDGTHRKVGFTDHKN